ncbi:Alpha/Beta hydrolase protein [Pseudomassariella vexata]|uniref:Alpha/Beta hydrolase protein n=1 Tax=Pseudomassariella vexata TaxID=1141098 RepID=A0A1Y2D9H7_9PEZI|nr:Alpha/Beta hydrolase protein [Pseudomassariella vexata]ORY55857.1 Alpha/Beta hydrolase protein [Pseudomassariella vexata]
MISRAFLQFLLVGSATIAGARRCTELTVPVNVSSRNGIFDLEAPSNKVAVTDFVLNLARQGHNYSNELLLGYTTMSSTYSIAATYCEPDAGPGKALQILTHGIGFDRSYWDFPTNDYNYSYVNAALAANYSTFTYDRLGTGQSYAPSNSPMTDIQPWPEISSLGALTSLIRSTALPGVSATYPKIFHIGHSFGSRITYNLAATYISEAEPISDGIVLTGFSHVTFLDPYRLVGPYFPFGCNFVQANTFPRFSTYPDGYLALGALSALQIDFFAPGNFDPDIVEAAFESTQPVAVGELLTLNNPGNVNSTFEGPVLVMTGERDIPACGGNCMMAEPSIPALSQQFFKNTTDFETVIVPNAAHGLNLEYSHSEAYTAILDFLDKRL